MWVVIKYISFKMWQGESLCFGLGGACKKLDDFDYIAPK